MAVNSSFWACRVRAASSNRSTRWRPSP